MGSIAFTLLLPLAAGIFIPISSPRARAAEEPAPDWTRADRQPSPTAEETRDFMKRLPSAAAQGLFVLQGKKSWEQHRVPSVPPR